MESTVGVLVRMPIDLREQVTNRAIREKRSANAEILAMLEWALAHMPEQLQSSP